MTFPGPAQGEPKRTATLDSTVVGIAGLGLVGKALASRLVEAGARVIGFDVNAAQRASFDAAFAGAARASVADLAREAPTLLIAVFDDAQVVKVVESLLAATPRATALVACVTTALPATLQEADRRCARAGIAFVEAPLSGSSARIAAGEARMFVGGAADDIGRATPLLAAIASRRSVIGVVGQASAAKLATNLVLGLNRAALAEGMVLAERLGIARERFLELLLDSAATSRAAEDKGAQMASARFEPPVATVAQHAKDVGLMLALGRGCGQSLPLTTTHMTLLQDIIDRGDGGLDNAAVIRGIEALRA